MRARLPLPIRLALRELRGGLAGFRIFIACLALGVAAIAAVGSVRAAIEQGLAREAANLLGGDAEVEFTYRFADPDERAWMDAHATAVSEIVDFRSMAATAGADPTLVQVKAIDNGYPLYGTVALAGGGSLADALAARDGLPGLVAERTLIDRLGLAPGDVIGIGTRDFRLADSLVAEPDPAGGGFGFGPRVIVRLADLAESGLLAEGSLFDSSYRLRLPLGSDLPALEAEAEARFGDSGLQWRDRRDGAPGLGRFVERLGAFLILVGLAGLAVGGVGVAAAVRAHMEARTATIATLKTLGATGGTVFAIYLIEIALLALVGIALGLVVGAVLPAIAIPLLADRLPVPVTAGLHPAALAEAALYGLLTAFLFTLWPLARARDIRAAELFRDLTATRRSWPRLPYLAATAALALVLVAAATFLSGAPELALATAGGVAGALALLLLAAHGLRALARRAGTAPAALAPALTILEGDAVAPHLFAVAAGLESMVLGEAEILGQLRRAHELARAAGA
ncbi:MAG TPA: FtsX-like permease family protein, partial [Amaricoccus sp.]|nr:FtsX-like permease family protein [Amaricoccus sp.]